MTGMLPAIVPTERLTLRPPRRQDAPAVFARYARDPEVTRYLTWRTHESLAQSERFVDACVAAWGKGRGPWVLTRTGDDSAIGMIDLRIEVCRAELGYVLARSEWGRGLMSEAAAAVVELALAEPGIYRAWAVCDVDNRASARVLEKAGMALEARLRRYAVHPNLGREPRDVLLFARTR